MEILNKADLDSWLFERSNIQGHTCKGIKGSIQGEQVNIAWIDTVTGERMDIVYGDLP